MRNEAIPSHYRARERGEIHRLYSSVKSDLPGEQKRYRSVSLAPSLRIMKYLAEKGSCFFNKPVKLIYCARWCCYCLLLLLAVFAAVGVCRLTRKFMVREYGRAKMMFGTTLRWVDVKCLRSVREKTSVCVCASETRMSTNDIVL